MEIWWRAFQTLYRPLLARYNCFVDTGASDQLPLDPLPELLPGHFLPSELSFSPDSEANVSEPCVDKDWLGLLLVFGLLEFSDLHEPWVFSYNFLFKSWTWHFNASTVSKFFSSAVRSVEDMLLLASILLGSRTVFGFLWCRDDGSSSLHLVRISDLTTTLLRAFSEADCRRRKKFLTFFFLILTRIWWVIFFVSRCVLCVCACETNLESPPIMENLRCDWAPIVDTGGKSLLTNY